MPTLLLVAAAPDKKFRAFDIALGRVVASKRKLRNLTQDQLATEAGMPLTNLRRAEAGSRSLNVPELETIADVLAIPAGVMAEEALSLYGGLDKLRAEAKPN